MRKFKFLLGLGSILLALSSLNTFSNGKQYSAHAESNTTYIKALAKERFQTTMLATTGGFLSKGNSTILCLEVFPLIIFILD